MSNLKYDALAAAGIEIGTRVPLPAELIPPDANVEMEAKKAAGYFTDEETLQNPADVVGRDLKDY
jgi:GTP cyclohydrolase II